MVSMGNASQTRYGGAGVDGDRIGIGPVMVLFGIAADSPHASQDRPLR